MDTLLVNAAVRSPNSVTQNPKIELLLIMLSQKRCPIHVVDHLEASFSELSPE
jgi:hypothetical protein